MRYCHVTGGWWTTF